MNKIWSAKITLSAPMLLALMIVQIGLTVFSNTSAVRADGANPAGIPPVNAKTNAKYVNSIQAAKAPAANKLLPLNANKQFPVSVIPQGPGSGLNADTLDGLDSSAFASAGHSHFGQKWNGIGEYGFEVETYPDSNNDHEVAIDGDSGSSGAFSTGVEGTNYSHSGWVFGVWGTTNSPEGAGVSAQGAANGPALEIMRGGIKVDGAGVASNTPAFIQQVTSANIPAGCGTCTLIDNPLTNGNPNVILIVTPVLNPAGASLASGIYDSNPIGVWYDGAKWEILHENGAAITVGAAYNVLVITP